MAESRQKVARDAVADGLAQVPAAPLAGAPRSPVACGTLAMLAIHEPACGAVHAHFRDVARGAHQILNGKQAELNLILPREQKLRAESQEAQLREPRAEAIIHAKQKDLDASRLREQKLLVILQAAELRDQALCATIVRLGEENDEYHAMSSSRRQEPRKRDKDEMERRPPREVDFELRNRMRRIGFGRDPTMAPRFELGPRPGDRFHRN
jgi:hypothetical protein